MLGLRRQSAEAERGQPPVFDRDYLARLGSHIGADALRELAADGLLQLTDRIARARELVRDGDGPALAALAHDIASVAGHLGLTRLSHLAVATNRAVLAEPDDPAATEAGEALCEAGPPALVALRAYLDETAARPQNRG